jgi:hypothetical protein
MNIVSVDKCAPKKVSKLYLAFSPGGSQRIWLESLVVSGEENGISEKHTFLS